MSRIVRRTVTAPAVPRWLRPRLSKAVRLQVAIIQLQKLRDIDTGVADETTLLDMARDAFTWSRVAETLGSGREEMAMALETTTRLIEHFGRTGRAEWPCRAIAQAARLAAAYYEDLAELVDHETAKAATEWSEQQVAKLVSLHPGGCMSLSPARASQHDTALVSMQGGAA